MASYLGKLPAKNLTPKANPPCRNCAERTEDATALAKSMANGKKGWMAMRKAQRLAAREEARISDVLAKGAIKTKTERKNRRADNA